MYFDNAATNAATNAAPGQMYQCDPSQMMQDFVCWYYQTLSVAPHEAWRFYTVNGQYLHVDGDANMVGTCPLKPAVGQYEINSNVMFQRFDECKFAVNPVHVQHTIAAHLVLVTGHMVRNAGPPVPFVQTFVVECIPEINQYVISNTILKTLIPMSVVGTTS